MIKLILSALALGSLLGYYVLPLNSKNSLDQILMHALYVTVFIGGLEIGSKKKLIKQFLTPNNLGLLIAVPLAVTLGSLTAGVAMGSLLGMSLKDSLLISGGLGWYSFSSVTISALYSVKIGTMAFITNALREITSFLLVPLMSKYAHLPCVAIGGASTMDSTLPIIIKYTNTHIAIIAFFNGLILSLIVPLLISWLLGLA